jgi:hypothetical protein
MSTTNRLKEIYQALGRVLNDPLAFGLGNRAPKPLLDTLTSARKQLMEELIEQKCWPEDGEESLEAELSQDADTCSLPSCKAS